MQVLSLFPTPLYTEDISISKEVQDTLYSLDFNSEDSFLPNKTKVSDVWGEQSVNKQILRMEPLKEIREHILIFSKKFATEIMGFFVDDIVDILSWVSSKNNNQEHLSHVHPNSFISGVLFFDDEYDESTALVFEKNAGASATFQMTPKKNHYINNIYSSYHFSVPAAKGRLIMFPSYLPHFVPKNNTDKPRYSLAFNLMPTQGLGDIGCLTEFKYLTALQY